MDVEKLITHLRYATPYHGDVRRDTLDALERLNEVEARCESLEEQLSELPDLQAVIDSAQVLKVYVAEGDTDHSDVIDDLIEQLGAAYDRIEELRGVA